EVAPSVLRADQGVPPRCAEKGEPCERNSVLGAIASLRAASQSRLGIADLTRNCGSDPLFEDVPGPERRRICFAMSAAPGVGPPRYASDVECCRAQARLRDAVNSWYRTPEQRSTTAFVHAWLLPLKVFFLLNLLVISVLLFWRHHK